MAWLELMDGSLVNVRSIERVQPLGEDGERWNVWGPSGVLIGVAITSYVNELFETTDPATDRLAAMLEREFESLRRAIVRTA
jgi:hypothetical protein